jgi:hypothetical protein
MCNEDDGGEVTISTDTGDSATINEDGSVDFTWSDGSSEHYESTDDVPSYSEN